MKYEDYYYLHRDGKGGYVLQHQISGLVAGFPFLGMPGESAYAFSRDYGSVWYPEQIVNLADFPELAEVPFFTIASCGNYELDDYFRRSECQPVWPLLAAHAKLIAYSPNLPAPPPVFPQQKWQYKVPNPHGSWTMTIMDLWVNEEGCWLCLRDGGIIVVNHQGELIQRYNLPKDSRCLAVLGGVPYASCQDGYLYELTGKLPQAVYDIRPLHYSYYYHLTLAMVARSNYLAVADAYGYLEVLNNELKQRWQHHQPKHWQSWFLGIDDQMLYQGHYRGVSAYDLKTGKQQWFQPLAMPVLSGLVTSHHLLIACADQTIYALGKEPNPKTQTVNVTSIYTSPNIPYRMTLAGDGASFWLGGHTGLLERLNLIGTVQESIPLGAGGITGIQIWQNGLYLTTGLGILISLEFI